jgi:putative membrane protein
MAGMTPKRPEPILSPVGNAAVAAAVAAVEARANAEVVTVISRRADEYGDVALAWSALVAGLALLAINLAPGFYLLLIDRALGLWAHSWTLHEVLGLALIAATVKFAAMWLLMQWRPLRLALTPRPIKTARVRARAQIAFRLAVQGRTRGATGVVIYLSMAERRAEIIADDAIASKVAAEVWGDAMHAMLAEIRDGNIAGGLVTGVDQVGAVLATHFPRTEKPGNELPDGAIEL